MNLNNNKFILTRGESIVRISTDSDDWTPVVPFMLDLVKAGFTLTYEAAPPEPAPAPARPIHKPARKGAWKKLDGTTPRKQGRPKKQVGPVKLSAPAAPPPGSAWNTNDSAYLNWPALAEDAKLKLSKYRARIGTVEDFRSGQGIRKTVGVRFDQDPGELTWLAPDELSASPVYA